MLGFRAGSQGGFLAMIGGSCDAFGICIAEEDLRAEAIEWSQTRGGRSGRVAWQFVTDLAGRRGVRLQDIVVALKSVCGTSRSIGGIMVSIEDAARQIGVTIDVIQELVSRQALSFEDGRVDVRAARHIIELEERQKEVAASQVKSHLPRTDQIGSGNPRGERIATISVVLAAISAGVAAYSAIQSQRAADAAHQTVSQIGNQIEDQRQQFRAGVEYEIRRDLIETIRSLEENTDPALALSLLSDRLQAASELNSAFDVFGDRWEPFRESLCSSFETGLCSSLPAGDRGPVVATLKDLAPAIQSICYPNESLTRICE